ncbi:MAG TPA: DUF1015 domain-containing protein [Acidimicrobiia bacterium]|nr:DUF1015 domain-containing protein [Acidimicrobiia bacterium]
MVPDLFPFPGLRYQLTALHTDLGAVTAPPYDVIDEEGRARLEAAHPQNAVRLILPRDAEPGDRYRRAREAFDDWQAEGLLAADTPHLYVYRMGFTDDAGRARRMIGVVGALALSPPGEDVLPHERTMTKAKSDRLDLLRSVRANLDPVWMLSRAVGLSELFEPVLAAGDPAASCVDEDGVEHCLFPVEGDLVDRIREKVATAPLIIADGHHRYETALAYRDEQRKAGVDDPGADRIMTLVVELAEEQLFVQPIHRLIFGASGHFIGKLNTVAEVEPMGANNREGVRALMAEMERTEGFGLVAGPGLALLKPRLDALRTGLERLPDPLWEVDTALLDVLMGTLYVQRDAMRIPDDIVIDFRHDALTVASMVAKGMVEAAILLRPVSVPQIEAVAEAGLRMPQKTTFFQPKPLTGLVFRSLDLG